MYGQNRSYPRFLSFPYWEAAGVPLQAGRNPIARAVEPPTTPLPKDRSFADAIGADIVGAA